MAAPVGWWAENSPLHLGDGWRYRSRFERRKPIWLPTDHRTRHLYCVGSSGSGKSRFARHLILQDLQANRGWTLVDPQDLSREVLAHVAEAALGPGRPNRQRIDGLGDKLVILEPARQDYGVPGINLLEVQPGQVGYQIVDGMLEVIAEIWPDAMGARLLDITRHGLLLLLELGLTVVEMLPLLSDEAFRRALVQRSRNPDVHMFFTEHLAGLQPREARVWLESSRNKWSAFLSNPFIRPILGQTRSTINLRQIIDQGKILLVNVSRDKLKESRRLLGALLVHALHQAAIARDDTPPERRYLHSIYCDEFQEFWTPSFLHILEGGRKYGLALAMFHQNLTQPPFNREPAIVDTILSNTHTKVCFNVSRKDAEIMAGELFFPTAMETKFQQQLLGVPLERPTFWSLAEEREHYAGELMHQQAAEAYVNFKGLGDGYEPMVTRIPRVPDVTSDPEKIDILRRHVASRYYRPLEAVEREINDRRQRIRQEGTNHDFHR